MGTRMSEHRHTQSVVLPRPRITLPELGGHLVSRPALLDALDHVGEQHTVALVCAPAGYGKTVLLTQWGWRHRLEDSAVAWVTCKPRDCEASTLFTTVRDALALAVKDTSPADADRLMQLAQPTADSLESSLAQLLMAVSQCRSGITLVLDDVHHLQGDRHSEVLEAVILGLTSAGARVALGSRTEPVKLMNRLRLLGQVTVVEAADLALSREQIEELFTACSPELLDSVYQQTQGWPAAVRFAVLAAMSGSENDIVSHDPALASYLSSEVLGLLPAPAVAVLRSTAVVEEISADLAVHLTGRADAGRILDDLFRSQYLIRRIAGQQPWYVVHTLLRQQLLSDLAADDARAPQRQNAAAARWFADQGLPEPALRHARSSGDPSLLGDLVGANGMRLIAAGATEYLIECLDEVSRSDDRFVGLAALARAESGDLQGARRVLSRSAGSPPLPAGSAGPSTLQTAQFCVRRLEGSISDVDLDPGVLAWEPAESPDADNLDRDLLLLLHRGQWLFAVGDYENSFEDLRRALRLASDYRRDRIALRCMATLAGSHAIAGESRAQTRYAEEVLGLIEARGWATVPALANIYSSAAWAAHNQMLPARAELMINRAHAALQASADPEYVTHATLVDAALQLDRAGDVKDALMALDKLARGGQAFQLTPKLRSFAAVQRVRICLRAGDLTGAQEAIALVRMIAPTAADSTLCEALVEHSRDRWELVADLLDRIERDQLPLAVRAHEITLLLMQSLAARRANRRFASRTLLLEALALAGPRGVLRPFFEVGPAVHEMLTEHRGQLGVHEESAGTILARWADLEAFHDQVPHGQDRPAVLTPRQMEVLRELPTLMTVEEIAAVHHVSPNTIRTHMRQLYGKLGVHTRRDAVRRGRELDLLP